MKYSTLILGLSLASLIALGLAASLGSTPISFQRIGSALIHMGTPSDEVIIWHIRLPRALAAYLTGLALGASGAALQGLLRNPLAEPGVLGVSASASLGAVLAIYYGLTAITPLALPAFAIIGALAATLLIAVMAIYTDSVVSLILVGVGLSSFAAACLSLLMNLAPHPFSLTDMITWMLGSVANRSFDDILMVLPFMALGAGLLTFTRTGLSVLTLGEETAAGMGLNLVRLRFTLVLGTGLMTGAAVALAGAIGFVGIVAPHLIRPFVKGDPARTLLPAALLGGILLVMADIGIRLIPSQNELHLGVMAALLGAPIFIWIVLQRRGTL